MVFAVPQDWTDVGGVDDVRVNVDPAEGNWLIVTLTYRNFDSRVPLSSVADMAGNWWVLCGSFYNLAAVSRVEVWACPLVAFNGFPLTSVYAAVSHLVADDIGTVLVNVAEVSGFVNGYPTVVSATTGTASGTTLDVTIPDPGQPVFVLAAAATDDPAVAVTPPGTGWGALTGVSGTGPDLRLSPAWTAVSAPITASWSSVSAVEWTGLVVAIAETGTVWPQPNPDWPPMRLELAPGTGQDVPLPRVTAWVDHTSRLAEVTASRGIPYELGKPQAGEQSVALRNYDDAITPEAGGDYDLYTPWRLLAAWDGKVHPVAAGWLEELEQWWPDPAHGMVGADGVDALATLVQDVPTSLRGEVLRHQPYAYWPCGDESASPAAVDIAGQGAPALEVVASKYGVADITESFGAAFATGGDPGTGWKQTGVTLSDTRTGYALVGRGDGFPPIASGVTVAGMVMFPGDEPFAANRTLCILRSRDARNGTVIKFWVDGSGTPAVTVWDKDTAAATTFTAGFGIGPDTPRPWVLRFTRTGFRADYFDFDADPITGGCDLPETFELISFGGEADEFYAGNAFNGTSAHLAVFPRYLSDDEVDRYMDSGMEGFAGPTIIENTQQRAQRYLANAGSWAPRAIDLAGTAGSRDDESGTLLQRLTFLAEQEDGLLYGDGAGYVRFRSQLAKYQQTVRWTLGDDEAAGEVPFQDDARVTSGPTYLYNQVAVTNTDEVPGLFGTWAERTHRAADPTSQDRYGPRPLERTVNMFWAGDADALAHWLLALYKDPAPRFSEVTVDAASYPAAWPLVLAAQVGDLVDVVRRPIGQAAISMRCRIMHIKHELQYGDRQTAGRVTLALAAAPPPVAVCGADGKQRLGDVTIGWVW